MDTKTEHGQSVILHQDLSHGLGAADTDAVFGYSDLSMTIHRLSEDTTLF